MYGFWKNAITARNLRDAKNQATPWNQGYGPKTRAMVNRRSPEGEVPRPMPRRPLSPHWAGAWHPRQIIQRETMGTMGDDLSFTPAVAPVVSYQTQTPLLQAEQPSAWSNLWSGLANIITPAAQAYAQTSATSALMQAQQRAAAQTWNPAITGPAIAAQSWQQAYQSGSGMTPTMSIGTMALIGGGILAMVLITRKK